MIFDKFFLLAIISFPLTCQVEGNKVVFCFQEKTGKGDLTNVDQYSSTICSQCSHSTVLNIKIEMETGKTMCSNMLSNEDRNCETFHVPKNNNCASKRIATLDHHQLNENHKEKMANTSHCDIISKNIVALLQQHNLDGIYYAFKSAHDEKSSIMNLLKSLREAFKRHGYIIFYGSSNSHEGGIDQGFDIHELSSIVDFLILDTYDFHHPKSEPYKADHHAQLYSRPGDQENKTVDSLVDSWKRKGFPANKIILTIPLWGNCWQISTNQANQHPPFDAQPNTNRKNGKLVNQNDTIKYFDICKKEKENNGKVFQDPNKRMGPHVFFPAGQNQIVCLYDDPAMAQTKCEYVKSKGLAGVAVMHISGDDIDNLCDGGPFPMLTAIWKTLNVSSASSSASSIHPPYLSTIYLVPCLLLLFLI